MDSLNRLLLTRVIISFSIVLALQTFFFLFISRVLHPEEQDIRQVNEAHIKEVNICSI